MAPLPPSLPAWIASAIWTLSFPICLYPIFHLVRDSRRRASTRALAIGPSVGHSHQERWKVFNLAVWSFIALSHVGLIAYSILAALETSCYAGRPPDNGLQSHLRLCPKNQLLFALDVANFIVCPMYPIMILATYADLSLMHQRTNARASRWLKTYGFPVMGTVLVLLTGIVITANVGIRVHLLTPYTELAGPALTFQVWARHWANAVYGTWFTVLMVVALASTMLIMRLLPLLRQRSDSARYQRTAHAAQSRGGATARLLAVGGGIVKSASKGLLPGLLSPVSSSSIGRGSSSAAADSTSSVTGSSVSSSLPLPTLLSIVTATGAIRVQLPTTRQNTYQQRLENCLSHLRLSLAVLVATLFCISAVTIANVLPTVLYVCAGWLAGRIVFLCLFLATREVRHAVLLRRHVPNKQDAGTLALSAWEPGGQAESNMSGQSATVGQIDTFESNFEEEDGAVEVQVELVSDSVPLGKGVGAHARHQDHTRLRLMSAGQRYRGQP